jgi:hypothetical protein
MPELTGWVKDPRDERDYLYATKPLVALPDKVDLRHLLPPARDQAAMGSCVGHGIGAVLTARDIEFGTFKEWHSPQWIWNWGRKAIGMLNQNVGVYPRDVLKALVDNGCLFESSWPYSPNVLDQSDPVLYSKDSFKYKGFAFTRCVDGVEGIKSALADGNLVAVGSPWFSKWFSLSPAGTLSSATAEDSIAGGHMYVYAGYDNTIGPGVFLGRNSWKDMPNFMMYFSAIEVFKKIGGYDAYMITWDKPIHEPVPDPVPVPEPVPPTPEPFPPAPEPVPPTPEPIPEPPQPEPRGPSLWRRLIQWLLGILKIVVRRK